MNPFQRTRKSLVVSLPGEMLQQNGEEKGRRERRGNKSKGEGLGGTSALEHLPSRHEVLGLRSSTGQKNKKTQAWWSLYVRTAGKLQS